MLTRRGSLDELSSHLTFTTAGDNSSFTITYAEDGATTDFFHNSYSAGAETLNPGDLVTTITLVITPPDETGTFWDWSVSGENVSAHALSGNVWAQEWIYSHIDDTIVKTTDTEASLTDGAWNESTPVSFGRRTIGSNPGLGLTQGRQIIIDRQVGFSGLGSGGDFVFSSHSTFEEVRYRTPYDANVPLAASQTRVNSGQVIIDIVGVPGPANQPPTADAGPDQNVTDTDDGGDEDVTLDGSGSSDSDGTITDYDWEESSVPIATGVSPVVTLSVAVHTIDLTVTDDDTDTDTDSVIITVNPYVNVPPTADAGPDQNVTDTDDGGDEDVTLDGSGSSDSDGTIASYDWEEASVPIATGVGPTVTLTVAVHTIDLTVTDDDSATDSDSVIITVDPAPAAGPNLEVGVATGIDDSWTTVTLASSYTSMVVVGIPNYDDTSDPMVVRIRNASGNSFDLRVDPAGGAAPSPMDVHWMVVEEGVYTQGTDGVTMEAVKYLSTVTDENNSWDGEAMSYANAYTDPVVLGQVMTYNDAAFSTFWCCDGARQGAPDSGGLAVGKHVGEDSVTSRADETIGYIVIEEGSGTISGIDYVAALGADGIKSVTNAPPYSYSFSGLAAPSVVVATQAAMDGNNGSWAVLYGSNPLSATSFNLAVDEDAANDTERSHTGEQVGYIVFD